MEGSVQTIVSDVSFVKDVETFNLYKWVQFKGKKIGQVFRLLFLFNIQLQSTTSFGNLHPICPSCIFYCKNIHNAEMQIKKHFK